MKTNKIILTASIITSLGTTAFAADTTVGTGDGIAYGNATETSTYSSIAIGNTVKSSGSDSIGIGYDVTVNGFNSIAIGSSRNKPGVENNPQKTIVTGGDENIGIGHKVAILDGYESVAIGSNARVYNNDNNDAYKNPSYSTVIGSSASSTGYNGTAYGRFATVKEKYATALGPWTQANGEYSAAIAYGAKANAENSIAVGNGAEANGRGSTAIGEHAEANGEDSLTIGSNSHANSNNSIAIGANAIANGENNIALGYNSNSTDVVKTSNALINGHNYKFAGSDPTGTLSIGGTIEVPVLDANGEPILNEDYTDYLKTTKEVHRTITNVAAGRISEESTDAVNGSQLHAVIKAVNEVAANDKDTITTVVAGKNATVTEGTNAAGGKEYTVAVNEHLTNMKSAAFHSDGVMPGSGGDTHISGSGIHVNDLEDNNSANISPKTIYVRTEGHAQSDLKSDELRIQNYDNGNASLLLNTDGLYVGNGTPGTTVQFTTKGISAGDQKIENVKAGTADTDAVNVKQLKDELAKNHAVESVITDNQIDNIAAVRVTNGKSTGEANAQYGVYVSKNTVTDIAKASNQFKGDDVIRVERTTGVNHTADTTTFKFDGNEASKVIPISYKANGGTVNKVTVEKGFNFVDGNHIKASTDTNGLVRFDLDQEIPKQIERNTNNIEKITNRYDALTTKVAKNYKTAERGIAGTAALAALHPLDFDPDHKLDVMAGVGHFHVSNSVALGAAYRPNEDLMFTVGSTVGNGDTVLNAGVSYKVGAKSDVSRSKVAVAKDVADMKREMAEMKAQNAKITAILNIVLGVGLPEDQNVMFPDVPQNHWAFEAVDDLARRGLIIGYEDGLFKGDRTLTRYEFAEIVHRAIQRAKALNVPIDGRLVDEFKPELLRFEVEKNGSLERVHALKSNRDIKRDSYGTIVGVR